MFLKSHVPRLSDPVYLGLISAEWEGEVSVQQSVLLHENHAVFVGMPLSARYQAARGSETTASTHMSDDQKA